MSTKPSDIWTAMIGAARESLGNDWHDVKTFAEPELKRLARTLLDIGRQAASGEISEAEARALLRIHRNTTQIVLLTARGMSLLAVENAINAALDAARAPLNAALGIALL